MSVTAADVERWARALGVGWDGGLREECPLKSGKTLAVQWRKAEGLFDVAVELERGRFVDPLTAALILLGHARGLRVDVGECPACRERGSKLGLAMWKWAALWTGIEGVWSDVSVVTNHGQWTVSTAPLAHNAWTYAWRPCPSCTIDGAPTGRHTLTWEAAIIAAMPSLGGKEVHERAQAKGKSVSEWHRQVREALRVMAHTIAGPEHVAIVGDWCAEHERNTAANFPGEPQGGLGELVTAWLRGECPKCRGSGRRETPYTSIDGRRVAHWSQCSACRGHGSVLGGFECELAQAIEAELGRRAA